MRIQHLYLLSPLHTGGATQEGNLLGIARESHTNFPYIPSSAIRGKLRSLEINPVKKNDEVKKFLSNQEIAGIERVLVLSDQHCATVIQMGLWRQVKIKLNDHKTVQDGSLRYEEAIPPDSLMYFPWGTTSQTLNIKQAEQDFTALLSDHSTLQIGGQESLGRGFVESFT
ncbi:MAG: hypothetical protein GC158_16100 [Cyanobacteria bacterium RI_101]|nr:hypothetical protein [Cyanobacteria bacterium RI_101]